MDELKKSLYRLIVMGNLTIPNQEPIDIYVILKEAVEKHILPEEVLVRAEEVFG